MGNLAVTALLEFQQKGWLPTAVIYNGIGVIGIGFVVLIAFGMKDVVRSKDFDKRRESSMTS